MVSEAVDLLSRLIRIDTSNPPGREKAAADFITEILDREKIAWRTYEPAPERMSVRAVIPGTGQKKPLILLNHLDTAPADGRGWSFDPFGGDVRDGFVRGRGALDMKGLGVMELLAFLDIKRQGIVPCRDLIFLAVADEEAGGAFGVEHLLNNHEADFRAGLVLNEGGFGLEGLLPGRTVHMISSAEKGPCWLRLVRTGSPGHGSMPHGNNALEKLVAAAARVAAAPQPLAVAPVVKEYFRRLGAAGWNFLQPFVEDGRSETLLRLLRESGLLGRPEISAMLQNTVSLNRLYSGFKINVIPDRAEAELDARLLPGQEIDAFCESLRRLLADDDIQVERITAFEATASPAISEDFCLLERALGRHFPDAAVAPSLSVGTTDSRFFRRRGVSAYGFFPVVAAVADLKMVHGFDEKISVENLERGTRILTEVVRELCL
ncbi:MAG: M20/M25/M40 family metallo-hydrolase [Pseudomonadota bacterium]